jgi:nitrite reductase/ring-hydroxylating ferredoxin subunit
MNPPPTTTTTTNSWIYIGHPSTIPNIEPTHPSIAIDLSTFCSTTSSSSNSTSNSTTTTTNPPYKILPLPPSSSSLLIFRYRNRIHAIDHACPHSTYPLSRGTVYDIEDFGIVLSAGIQCPKHGWRWDLFTGEGERGTWRLGVWDVDVRGEEEEVWVRRRREG